MPVYAITPTKEGIKAVEEYDGDNSNINYLQALLLARSSNGCTTLRELTAFVHENDLSLAEGALSTAISKMEQKGLVTVTRDVTLDTRIVVCIGSYRIPCKLGDFVSANLPVCGIPITEICDDLKWHGKSVRMPDVRLSLK